MRGSEEMVHLLVTDVVMPRMSGTELAARIRLLRPDVHVLYISGYTDQTASLNSAFLKKPFTPDEFARAVEAVLEDGRGLP